MPRKLSLGQYRSMDLCSLTALCCVGELLIVLAATRWFPGEPYTLSLVPAVTALVMVRWGAWAAIPAVCGAMAFCLASGAQLSQFLIYGVGNLAALALLIWLRRATWRKLDGNVLVCILYGWTSALLMQAGRAAAALLLGAAPSACLGFLTTDVLSAFFSALLMWVCRRLDGMLEEQTHYILRIQREQEDKRNSGGMNA